MQIFDIVSPELFRPLTGCNRREYADVLAILWELLKKEPVYALERSTIVEAIEQYFLGIGEMGEIDLMEDIDPVLEEEQDQRDARKMANAFLRRLKKTGWLEEKDGGYTEESQIMIRYQVIPLIKAFAETVTPKAAIYQGKLYKIYTLLSHIAEQKHPYETILKEISVDMELLIDSLRQMAASISVYMDNLTRGKTPQEVLEFFNHYEEKIVAGAYHRFKTQDNFFYYRSEIGEQLEECLLGEYERLASDCMQAEHCTMEEAEKRVRRIVEGLKENLMEIYHIMRLVDDRHLLYRTKAVSRAQFLLTADGSMKSKMIHLLRCYAKGIREKQDLLEIDDTKGATMFQIYETGYFSAESLYSPSSKRREKEISVMEYADDIGDFFLEEEQDRLYRFAMGALTQENVNLFAQEMLKENKSILASEILARHPEEIVKLIGLHTYSKSTERTYDMFPTEQLVEQSGLRFYDFEICGRK